MTLDQPLIIAHPGMPLRYGLLREQAFYLAAREQR
jgi:hypothetical protein